MTPINILCTHPLSSMFSDDLAAMLKDDRQFRIFDGNFSFGRIQDVLSGRKIDLIIARLDGKDPLQTINKMMRSASGQKIIISGEISTDVIFECIKAGIKGHLDSSISADLLSRAIKVVHNGEVWFDRNTSSKVLEQFAVRAAGKGQNRKIDLLTAREKEVLGCAARGLKNKEIASCMFISENTVKTHLFNIYDKLGVTDRVSAVLMMREE